MARIVNYLLDFVPEQQLLIPSVHKFISVEWNGNKVDITALIEDKSAMVYRNIHITTSDISTINVHHAVYIGTLKERDGFFLSKSTYYIIAGDVSNSSLKIDDHNLLRPMKLSRSNQ